MNDNESMFRWIQSLLSGGRIAASTPTSAVRSEAENQSVPVYPPVDTGYPSIPVKEVVTSQKTLEDRIFRAMGISQMEFSKLAQPVIEHLAAFVHLLPATAHDHHAGAGGLFKLCLEISLHSLQGANTAVFPDGGGVERRYFLQSRWAMATWLAGLCCQVHRVATDMIVVSDKNQQWQPLLIPLSLWLRQHQGQRYFVRWQSQRDSEITAMGFIMTQILTDDIIEYLSFDNHDVVPTLTKYLSLPGVDPSNPIGRIVSPTAAQVIELDRKKSPFNYGKMTSGSHLEPHIISAMRCLLEEGEWLVNGSTGTIHIGEEGVFVDWGRAAASIQKQLASNGSHGIPTDPDTLMDLMVGAGVFEPPNTKSRYWTINPSEGNEITTAAKFAVRNLIFPDDINVMEFSAGSLIPSKSNAKKPLKETVPPTPSEPPTSKAPRKSAKKSADAPPPSEALRDEELLPSAIEPPPSNDQIEFEPDLDPPPFPFDRGEPPLSDEGCDGVTEQDPSFERALSELKKEHAWLLREIVQAYQKGSLTGKVFFLPKGVAVTHEELMAHGQQVVSFIDELANKQWLWVNTTMPRRNMHEIEVDGKPYRALILKKERARELGFRE